MSKPFGDREKQRRKAQRIADEDGQSWCVWREYGKYYQISRMSHWRSIQASHRTAEFICECKPSQQELLP